MLDPHGTDADHSLCGRDPGHVQTVPVSELCSGNFVLVGDLAPPVRADSSVVSWLNVRVTHQVQDTSLGSNHSPFENPPGDDTQWKVQSERKYGTDDVHPERSTGHLGESQRSETGHQLNRGPGR